MTYENYPMRFHSENRTLKVEFQDGAHTMYLSAKTTQLIQELIEEARHMKPDHERPR